MRYWTNVVGKGNWKTITRVAQNQRNKWTNNVPLCKRLVSLHTFIIKMILVTCSKAHIAGSSTIPLPAARRAFVPWSRSYMLWCPPKNAQQDVQTNQCSVQIASVVRGCAVVGNTGFPAGIATRGSSKTCETLRVKSLLASV
eukprot:2520575-Amphidinium_carterae.1